MKLTADLVETFFVGCIANGAKDVTEVDGILAKVAFSTQKLEEFREDISDMLDCLPAQFGEKTGGGWSFLQACDDREGNQWTGLHQRMDQLFMLGTGIGRVVCPMPKEFWTALPGGMPYYMVKERA